MLELSQTESLILNSAKLGVSIMARLADGASPNLIAAVLLTDDKISPLVYREIMDYAIQKQKNKQKENQE